MCLIKRSTVVRNPDGRMEKKKKKKKRHETRHCSRGRGGLKTRKVVQVSLLFTKQCAHQAATLQTNKCQKKKEKKRKEKKTQSGRRGRNRNKAAQVTQVAFKPRVGRNKGGKMWDSPVLVEDQLFAMEMDDKTREVHSLPRGWDGGQSARAPATPGLTRARPGRLIPLTAFIREGREGVMHIITDARAECVCACVRVCVCECVCKPEKEERAYRWPDVNVNLAYPLQALGARWQQKQSKSLWNWFYNWLFINLFSIK